MLSFSVSKHVGMFALAGVVALSAGAARADNYANMLFTRVNEQDAGFLGYQAQLELEFSDPVISVVGMNGVDNINMTEEDPGRWVASGQFNTPAEMGSAAAGNYVITVTTATGTSTMSFTLTNNLSALTESNFLPLPQITNPIQGQTGVDPQPLFTWNPNGNNSTPPAWVISVNMESDTVWDDGINVNGGSMNIADTQWQSSMVLNPGHATFNVEYGTSDPAMVPLFLTNFSQDAGTGGIVWSGSPYAPTGYYDALASGTPLLAVLSSNTVGFEVVPEPATLALIALAGPALLIRRRRDH